MVATQIARRDSGAKLIQSQLVPLAALLALLLPAGQVNAKEASPDAPEPPAHRVARLLLETPEEKLNIARAALALDVWVLPDVDIAAGLAQIRELAAKAEKLVGGRQDGDSRIRAINTVLRDEGFTYDKSDMMGKRRGNSSLASLLKRRRGNCTSLPILWYAIAEQLGYPVFAVEAPQHFFLRYDDGTYRSNIEVTSGGGAYSDAQYIQDLEIPRAALRSGIYLRSLSKREYLAALVANMATVFYNEGDVGSAETFTRLALKHHPASIMAMHQLAKALNATAAVILSFESLAMERNEQRKMADNIVAEALQLSHHAAKLGAARPLRKDYWVRIEKLRANAHTEGSARRLPPEPFDMAELFHQGGEPVTVNMVMPEEFYFSPMTDHDSCLATCSTVCGPAPGNVCAVASREKTRRRIGR